MRCPYCGNENPDDHRFCGMCGRPLVDSRSEPPTSDVAHESDSVPAPAYTGGMFNLGAKSDKPRDLDYLLEDDEEPKSNTGLILLTIVALALVVGLGWLRWRNSGFPYLKSLTSIAQPKPVATSESSAPSSAGPEQPNPEQTAPPQPATPNDAASQPSITIANPSATETTTPPPTSSANPTGSPPVTSAPAPDPNATASAPPPAPRESAKGNSNSEETDNKKAAPAAEATETAPATAKSKPVAKPAPKAASKPTDPVVIGERYLYGSQGFPQNCERGLHYVKPAADHSNPKAMITMGALYATGHCLSRDLPTAYRFFALALRGDPENAALRQNTERVWKQMTAEERKQAIRMTQ